MELPDCMISEMIKNLSYSDSTVKFRLVCKSWKRIIDNELDMSYSFDDPCENVDEKKDHIRKFGRYYSKIYLHNYSSKFNGELIEHCPRISWVDRRGDYTMWDADKVKALNNLLVSFRLNYFSLSYFPGLQFYNILSGLNLTCLNTNLAIVDHSAAVKALKRINLPNLTELELLIIGTSDSLTTAIAQNFPKLSRLIIRFSGRRMSWSECEYFMSDVDDGRKSIDHPTSSQINVIPKLQYLRKVSIHFLNYFNTVTIPCSDDIHKLSLLEINRVKYIDISGATLPWNSINTLYISSRRMSSRGLNNHFPNLRKLAITLSPAELTENFIKSICSIKKLEYLDITHQIISNTESVVTYINSRNISSLIISLDGLDQGYFFKSASHGLPNLKFMKVEINKEVVVDTSLGLIGCLPSLKDLVIYTEVEVADFALEMLARQAPNLEMLSILFFQPYGQLSIQVFQSELSLPQLKGIETTSNALVLNDYLHLMNYATNLFMIYPKLINTLAASIKSALPPDHKFVVLNELD